MFNYVSSPHYFAEVIIYGSFVIYTQGQLISLWLIFGFVGMTMAHQAKETQAWYHSKFPNYPKNRKNLVPYLW